MNKAKQLKGVNALLFFFLLYQAITGILLGWTGTDVLETLHPVGGAILVVLGTIHIVLNWGWVRATFFARK